jgi:hypothetical protein
MGIDPPSPYVGAYANSTSFCSPILMSVLPAVVDGGIRRQALISKWNPIVVRCRKIAGEDQMNRPSNTAIMRARHANKSMTGSVEVTGTYVAYCWRFLFQQSFYEAP